MYDHNIDRQNSDSVPNNLIADLKNRRQQQYYSQGQSDMLVNKTSKHHSIMNMKVAAKQDSS